MRALLRYVLLQIPGILLLSALLHFAWSNDIINARVAAAVLGLWLVKDALIYLLVRQVFEQPPPPMGAQALVGRIATARTEITQRGVVRIGGELWQARTLDGTRIPAGSPVVVVSAQGLFLTVAGAMRDEHRPDQSSTGALLPPRAGRLPRGGDNG